MEGYKYLGVGYLERKILTTNSGMVSKWLLYVFFLWLPFNIYFSKIYLRCIISFTAFRINFIVEFLATSLVSPSREVIFDTYKNIWIQWNKKVNICGKILIFTVKWVYKKCYHGDEKWEHLQNCFKLKFGS